MDNFIKVGLLQLIEGCIVDESITQTRVLKSAHELKYITPSSNEYLSRTNTFYLVCYIKHCGQFSYLLLKKKGYICEQRFEKQHSTRQKTHDFFSPFENMIFIYILKIFFSDINIILRLLSGGGRFNPHPLQHESFEFVSNARIKNFSLNSSSSNEYLSQTDKLFFILHAGSLCFRVNFDSRYFSVC